MKKQLHIARNGQVLGQFDSDKISHLLETGRLLPTDHYYDEGTSTWLGMDQWKEPEIIRSRTEKPDSKSDSKSENPAPEKSTGGRNSRSRGRGKSKKKGEPGLIGWIACLFVIGLAAGLWVWNQSLGEQITLLKEENLRSKTSESSLKKANDALNEITPSGSVRGIIIYEPIPGQTAIVSGATVGLYPRTEVEKVITALDEIPNATFTEKVERLKTQLPSPLAVTLTDSNGRLNLAVPDLGEYVIVASAAKGGGAETMHFLWLAGFKSENRPSLMVLLDEKNAISEKTPEIRIRNILGLAQTE